jgi:hypothetical protein
VAGPAVSTDAFGGKSANTLRENASARRTRYPRGTQLLHRIFDCGTFGRYIRLYLALLLLVSFAEAFVAAHLPLWLPKWTGAAELKPFLTNMASYLVGAQVGVLGITPFRHALRAPYCATKTVRPHGRRCVLRVLAI